MSNTLNVFYTIKQVKIPLKDPLKIHLVAIVYISAINQLSHHRLAVKGSYAAEHPFS